MNAIVMTETTETNALTPLMDLLVSIVEWFRALLPLDRAAAWIQQNLPFLEESHVPIIAIALVVLIVWFIWSWASRNLQRHAGYIIACGAVLAIAAYMGAITW